MVIPDSLVQYKIKHNQPNFLIGLPGNGITTEIQNEIYSNPRDNTKFIHLSNFHGDSEINALLKILLTIFKRVDKEKFERLNEEKHASCMELFENAIELIKDINQTLDLYVIFDGLHYILDFSNEFFYILARISNINNIFPNIKLTTVFISDVYLNPTQIKYKQALKDFFYINFNFQIIGNFNLDRIKSNRVMNLRNEYTDDEIEKIFKLSSGNPSLIISLRSVIRNCKNINELLQNTEIKWNLNQLWEEIGEPNQELLLKLQRNETVYPDNKLQIRFLSETNLYDFESMRFTNPLLEKYIEILNTKKKVRERNNLVISHVSVDLLNLPSQIAKVLGILHSRSGEIVTRDEIAQAMWGNKFIEKYSDYAIDRTIADLRNFFKSNNIPSGILQTKRGKGYKLVI